MVGKFLFATVGLGIGFGMLASTACAVKVASGGSGGATSSTQAAVTSSTTSTSSMSGVTCSDAPGTSGCTTCAAGGCGVPSSNMTLKGQICSDNTATGSLGLYAAFFNCLCGVDGTGGKCGSQCSKTCLNTGTDGGGCMGCLAGAVTGECSSAYNACKNDK